MEALMRHARNLNPEWGCIAPAPDFLRTARVFVVALAIGAMVSVGVVFSLIDRPIAEVSVAARTLVRPVDPTLPARSVPLAAQPQTQSEQTSLSQKERDAAGADSPAGGATIQRPPTAAALVQAPRIATTVAPPGGVLASEPNIAAESEAASAAEAAPAPTPAPRKPRAAAHHYNVPRYTRRYEPQYDSMERGSYAFLRQYGSFGREY
jgi:hypothetical protein